MTLAWSRSAVLVSALLAGACASQVASEKDPGASSGAGDGSDPNPDEKGSGSSGGSSGSSGRDSITPTNVRACKTDLTAELATLDVPGAQAGIVKNGKLVCVSAAGSANLAEGRPVTPDTVFAWASVSKTVTAVTLMTLLDEGKLTLDGDVNAHLPFQVKVPSCATQPITFRHLLTHTSSIIEDDDNGAYASSYVKGDSPVALGDFLKGYLVPGGTGYDAQRNFEGVCPGSKATYSNVGAGLLGYLAERIGGMPFDALAKARVLHPLGMRESSFRLKDFDLTHVAVPHERKGASFLPIDHVGFATYPDGLLRTSIPQMARFLLMFMNRGELDGVRVLATSTAEEMRKVQIPALDDTQGLIWYYEAFPGRDKTLGHDGGDPGTSSNMYFDPADGSGVLVVANGEWDEDAADELMGRLFAEAKTY